VVTDARWQRRGAAQVCSSASTGHMRSSSDSHYSWGLAAERALLTLQLLRCTHGTLLATCLLAELHPSNLPRCTVSYARRALADL
jgi:hypothetical protein